MQFKFLFYLIILFLFTTTISAQGIINKTAHIAYYHNQIEWNKFNGFALSGSLDIHRKKNRKTELSLGFQYKQTWKSQQFSNPYDTVQSAMENPTYPIWPYERTILTKEIAFLFGLKWKLVQRKYYSLKASIGLIGNYYLQYRMHGYGYIPVSPISPMYSPDPFPFRYSYKGKGNPESFSFCSYASIELAIGSSKNKYLPVLVGQICKDVLYENWCYLIGLGIKTNRK